MNAAQHSIEHFSGLQKECPIRLQHIVINCEINPNDLIHYPV